LLDDPRTIFREIDGILLQSAYRIAAALNNILDQRIDMKHGGSRIIREKRPLTAPSLGIPQEFLFLQRSLTSRCSRTSRIRLQRMIRFL
jgi:hypothetical protein